MSLGTALDQTREETVTVIDPAATTKKTLADLLHNSIVLNHTTPYLPLSTLFSLAATCRAIRDLIYQTPGVFRHLQLSNVKSAQFRPVGIRDLLRDDPEEEENLTEDEYYSGSLRRVLAILRQRDFLRDVQTLILDGLSVTAELVHEIITHPSYNVRVLSLRDVHNLNYGRLRGTLQYACRPGRPDGMPKLKALYVFGSTTDSDSSISEYEALASVWPEFDDGKSNEWWSRKGRIIPTHSLREWSSCLQACEGIIAFDAVLCRGPRHGSSPAYGRYNVPMDDFEAVATFAVPACSSCGDAPEGLVRADTSSLTSLPALYPPNIMTSSLRGCVVPQNSTDCFVPRCEDCLRERYCTTCHKWWCESCFRLPNQIALQILDTKVSKSCWECGNNCDDCINDTQKTCKKCRGGYCTVHNEGSCATYVRCASRGRGVGRL
ncbi:hypothetical protein B0I35DRAFT_359464 [Stachybotrys elegans]|uniref:F-box domain-containing protein n=1 Tax=Stachybotrys elegans TaxID=80388 RepID=A0A8K0SH99_9HYPO|nr:hypothetical protein B0I35DRAFT_359464 [Stachybotrys elegans]